jgi:hypothetical protein
MKNIFLLPTDKPSRLFKFANQLHLDNIPKDYYKKYNIYLTSDEKIKEGDWGLSKLNEVILFGRSYNEKFYKKIILTTDQDLIADGVQAIDDEFLEWFVKNPSCENVETKVVDFEVDMGLGDECIEHSSYYKIIIPQEEPKQETLEEAAERHAFNFYEKEDREVGKRSFIEGTKYQAKRMYSEEEVLSLILKFNDDKPGGFDASGWFEQFKKK